jgi:hypothetical protein
MQGVCFEQLALLRPACQEAAVGDAVDEALAALRHRFLGYRPDWRIRGGLRIVHYFGHGDFAQPCGFANHPVDDSRAGLARGVV